ncbi:MAG: hypothetical protein ABEH47_03345, partial [Haloferacaceae archaeon]
MSRERGESPDDAMRERAPDRGWLLWALVGADRRFVTASILAVVFFGLLGLGVAHPTPASELLAGGDPIETLFQALVTSTITGVTLVLTLSQLVLSQELGAVGDQRERMSGAMEFRRDVEDVVDADVSPTEPSAFLRTLVDATRRHAEALAAAVDGDGETAARIDAYVDDVVGNATEVTGQLEGSQFGEFEVVWTALNYDYSWKIYAGRRLRAECGDDLSSDAVAALDAL